MRKITKYFYTNLEFKYLINYPSVTFTIKLLHEDVVIDMPPVNILNYLSTVDIVSDVKINNYNLSYVKPILTHIKCNNINFYDIYFIVVIKPKVKPFIFIAEHNFFRNGILI